MYFKLISISTKGLLVRSLGTSSHLNMKHLSCMTRALSTLQNRFKKLPVSSVGIILRRSTLHMPGSKFYYYSSLILQWTQATDQKESFVLPCYTSQARWGGHVYYYNEFIKVRIILIIFEYSTFIQENYILGQG